MQKKLTLPSGEYLVVSVPKDVLNFLKSWDFENYKICFFNPTTLRQDVILIRDNFEIIGLASQITEEKAALICQKVIDKWLNYSLEYNQYKEMFDTALESFHSWLKANEIFFSNPIPEPECDPKGGYDDSWIDAYQEAQQNVSEEFLILKIMK